MIDISRLNPELPLTYKGERNYVQGADIWRASEELIKKEYPRAFIQKISFKKFAFGKCELQGASGSNNSFGNVLINDGSGNTCSGLLVDTKIPLFGRRDFDENKLWELIEVNENTAKLQVQSPFSFHDTVISMTKALIYRHSPPLNGIWVFVRATISVQPPCETFVTGICIKLTKEILGRFAQFEVKTNDIFIGTVDFGVGSP